MALTWLRRPTSMPLWMSAVLLLAVAGAAFIGARVTDHRDVPVILRGTTTGVNIDSNAFGFREDGGHIPGGKGYVVAADVPWTDIQGESFEGTTPSCLQPMSANQRIEIAVARLGGSGGWYGEVVVWVHCLG